MIAIYIGSDNRVRWDKLRDSRTDAYVNDAVVTCTLKTEAGTALAGASSLAMDYTAGSNGRYQGIIPYSAVASTVLTVNQRLWLEVTAVRGIYRDFRRIACVARYKGTE